ncbi:efflux RND transporter periplasmic adaptor subunit [Zunongwangia endophytica]|uniref:Efflux RND transporter periplasmic adaptor subunit n=1 Tax=Zunongwangia endophytica TaxID=1808945 RepID=A0ABV8H867_9FLAO|nr:efflux RND transporter periplasmic adaptor subunit [Zunongwangia endophytica]MDN3595541.1 efflux RND transporter periplasmic adaptor subunit [Zunongwangia endophytica]
MKYLKKIQLPLLAIVGSVILFGCKKESKPLVKEKECFSEKEMTDFKPLKITNENVVKSLRLNGVVAYNPNAVVNYVSLVGGIITNTYFTLGDKVEKNQVLAEIKSTELNSIEAEVKQIKANLEVAKRQLQSTQSFYDDGIASEKELIAAKSEKGNLESDLEKLQTNLKLYSASPEKGVFQIKAPRSGFVVDNKIAAGMQIGAEGDPLFTISDLDEVWINVNIYASDINAVKEGMPVGIKTSSYPDKVFEGKINRISNVLEPNENVLKARIVLDNKDLFLKPGLYVEAIVRNETEEKAPHIPAKSVVFNNNAYYIVKLEDKCNAKVSEVKILSKDENSFFIKEGLNEGDKIVTNNTLLLFESTPSLN